MHCQRIPGLGLVCSRRPQPRPCSVCRIRKHTKLCDGPGARPGKTCNAKLCDRCTRSFPNPRDPDDTLDYCPRCVVLVPQRALASTPPKLKVVAAQPEQLALALGSKR